MISYLECISNFVFAADQNSLKIFLLDENDYEDADNVQVKTYPIDGALKLLHLSEDSWDTFSIVLVSSLGTVTSLKVKQTHLNAFDLEVKQVLKSPIQTTSNLKANMCGPYLTISNNTLAKLDFDIGERQIHVFDTRKNMVMKTVKI